MRKKNNNKTIITMITMITIIATITIIVAVHQQTIRTAHYRAGSYVNDMPTYQ